MAEKYHTNFRYFEDGTVGISLDETTSVEDANTIIRIFEALTEKNAGHLLNARSKKLQTQTPYQAELKRTSSFLNPSCFQHAPQREPDDALPETIENKDLSLNTSMISLGSCTMKLNAASEMIPVSWPEFGGIHPFVPANQTEGYQQIIDELNRFLCEITGFTACSLQPNSGAQGEYAGLLTIRAYHAARKEDRRNVVLIPISAHGTNPASAVMVGLK
jgi:glycine dehydrogenase